jgi:hypothetical protein
VKTTSLLLRSSMELRMLTPRDQSSIRGPRSTLHRSELVLKKLLLRRGLVVSSPTATEGIKSMGRVARWNICIQIIPIFDSFGTLKNRTYHAHLVCLCSFWYNVWQSGVPWGHLVYYFPFWYMCTIENLASLSMGREIKSRQGLWREF